MAPSRSQPAPPLASPPVGLSPRSDSPDRVACRDVMWSRRRAPGMSLLLTRALLFSICALADVCTPSCAKEFGSCFNYRRQGYDTCREQLDGGWAQLDSAGCVPGCNDTASMACFRTPPTSNSPSSNSRLRLISGCWFIQMTFGLVRERLLCSPVPYRWRCQVSSRGSFSAARVPVP